MTQSGVSTPAHRPPPGENDNVPAGLAQLQARIRRLEGPRRAESPTQPLGLPAVDRHLPGGGLATAAVHGLTPAGPGDLGAATGFAGYVLGRFAGTGACLWILGASRAPVDLYRPGLGPLGVAGAQLVVVRAGARQPALWAAEEALRSPAVAAAVIEVAGLDLTAARRLQLAAEAGGATGLLLLRPDRAESQTPATPPGICPTRWHVAARPGRDPAALPGAAGAAWRLALVRGRGTTPADWEVTVDDATGAVAVVAASGGRAPAAPLARDAAGGLGNPG